MPDAVAAASTQPVFASRRCAVQAAAVRARADDEQQKSGTLHRYILGQFDRRSGWNFSPRFASRRERARRKRQSLFDERTMATA